MKNIIYELDESTKSRKLYREKTPIWISVSIYTVMFFIIAGLAFSYVYEINDSKLLKGDIVRDSKKSIYQANIVILNDLYSNIDFKKPIECSLQGANGKYVILHGYIESFEKDVQGVTIGRAVLNTYEDSDRKNVDLLIAKDNSKYDFEVQLKQENLMGYLVREFF